MECCRQEFAAAGVVAVSALSGEGLEALQDAVAELALGSGGALEETPVCAPNVRHRAILDKALEACLHGERALEEGRTVDLLAVDMQAALDHLGDIIGLTTPDDVLEEIFSRFCIGK